MAKPLASSYFDPDEIPQYEKMEEELRLYNQALNTRNKLPMLKYDDALFLRFRNWQSKRLAEIGRIHFGV